MKVLTIVGAPVGVKNEFEERRPLAYVRFSRVPRLLRLQLKWPLLVIEPAGRELKSFAEEVERRILDRLNNHPQKAFICPDATREHPHGRKIVTADDPDLLEAIQYDPHLWDEYGDGIVAGYYVLSTYSYIEDR